MSECDVLAKLMRYAATLSCTTAYSGAGRNVTNPKRIQPWRLMCCIGHCLGRPTQNARYRDGWSSALAVAFVGDERVAGGERVSGDVGVWSVERSPGDGGVSGAERTSGDAGVSGATLASGDAGVLDAACASGDAVVLGVAASTSPTDPRMPLMILLLTSISLVICFM